MRRNFIFALLLLLFLFPVSSSFAVTSIIGAWGYFTTPTTATPGKGKVNIAAGYIIGPNNIYVAVNTEILPNWELSAGKEIPISENTDLGLTPYILGSQYKFYGKDQKSLQIAGGGYVELLGDVAGLDGTPFDVYIVFSDYAGKLGIVNTGLGYTFGIDAEYTINFFFNMKWALVKDKLFLIQEFTNHSVRQGGELAWDSQRGVFNLGLLFDFKKFIKFNLVTYDILDDFITLGFGAEFSIDAF
jgi:hypothetical protein